MYGLEAISAYNGWSMSVIGACIVFTGLVVLSIAISQIHKLILLWESRDKLLTLNGWFKKDKTEIQAKETVRADHAALPINEVAILYSPIFGKLGESFQLEELYKLSKEYNFPHPHLTIKNFRQARILQPLGNGQFTVNLAPHASTD